MEGVSKNYGIEKLSPHLFWDVDRKNIEWEKNCHFLVQRILEYGFENDWEILKKQFGIKKIAKIATELRSLDDLSLNFIATISDIPIQNFRCYNTKQLQPHYSGY